MSEEATSICLRPAGVPSGLFGIASFSPLIYRRGADFILKETQ
jgi:hypothetical protein